MKLTMPWTVTEGHTNGVTEKLEDVRRALSDEAENLTQVATQLSQDIGKQATKVGQEAGTQAVTVARDASTNAGAIAQQLMKGATLLAAQIATTGRKSARDLSKDVKSLGGELRRVRVTTEPKRTGPNLLPIAAIAGGIASGFAAMFFLDPELGARRRAELRARLGKWTSLGRDTATEKAKDFANRTVGVMHDARTALVGAKDEATEEASSIFESAHGDGYASTNPTIEQRITEEQHVPIS